MPHYINKKDLYSSVQIGASQVASILHLSPWEDAFATWQMKTGRIPKPEQTPAMKFGLDNEERTIQHYFEANHIDARSMRTQVAAQHTDLPFLKCIADLWNESTAELVQVKSPSTPHLIKEMRSSGIPKHYAVQCLTEMAIFEAEAELLYVCDWTQEPVEVAEKIITWDEPWDLSMTCLQFWDRQAIPMLKEFWDRIVKDEWPEGGYAQPDEKEWAKAIKMRQDAGELFSKAENLKAIADANLKRMLGSAQSASAGGWKATWIKYNPTWAVNIKCQNPATLEEVMRAVRELNQIEGVREVKAASQPERRVFRVDELKDMK